MDQISQINLNERASIEVLSEKNSIDQQRRRNLDTNKIESDSETVIVNSNKKSSLIRAESIPEEIQAAANNVQAEPIPEEIQAADAQAELIPDETQAAANNTDKKRKHWTEDEHRQFLKGLQKYQRGQWKEISEEFVTTRKPSQIASHAQKYYDRQEAGQKHPKKRRSIHDTTIDNNGTLVTLPTAKQRKEIPSIKQRKENRIVEQIVIPSIDQQTKTSSLVTDPIDEQNEVPTDDTTLNDSNNDNLVTPPVEPLQGMKQEHKQLLWILRTHDILPHDMEIVTKMCRLLQDTLKR